jgi:hypothetical protein
MACGLAKINRGKVSTGIAVIFIIFTFLLTGPNTQAQTNIAFSPADHFSVPAYNGSISFAVNGTYSKATFENNTWTFTNLRLTNSHPLENFQISTQNSNATIFSYVTSNNTAFPNVRLRYEVEGQGKQILNLGLGPEEEGFEWTVSFNGVNINEGKNWSISREGTFVITDATGNISIVGFTFGNITPSNLPFYQQHSIAIAVAIAVVVIVVVAVAIKVTGRKLSAESELGKSTLVHGRSLASGK